MTLWRTLWFRWHEWRHRHDYDAVYPTRWPL